jgi:hypothetical protein
LIGDIASVATAFGVLVAAWALLQARRLRLRHFEDMFVARYWKLMDGLSLTVLRGEANNPVCDRDERAIRAYFQLCEDELELRAHGWITDATWGIWANGIRLQMRQWPFEDLWRTVTESESGRGRFEYLRAFMADPSTDPCKLPWWRRRMKGLTASTSV